VVSKRATCCNLVVSHDAAGEQRRRLLLVEKAALDFARAQVKNAQHCGHSQCRGLHMRSSKTRLHPHTLLLPRALTT
jgi:hypothetical protein